jgi:hypothetical protein
MAAQLFGRRQIGEIGAMPLARVDHCQPGRARLFELPPGWADRAAQ